jgi:hypothetical protein
MRHLAASLTMGVGMFAFIRVTNLPLDLSLDPPKAVLLVQTMVSVAFGGIVYVVASSLLRVSELGEILAFLRSRRPKAAAE